jgi:eukaryotic-like serine/threonine-protein kinase
MTERKSLEIRVLIADDHPIFREGLAKVISRDIRLHVVAQAENGDEAVAQLTKFRPDVAVLDLDMPERDGFAVTRAAQEAELPVKVIILTSHNNEALFHSALDLGVAGYVLKDGAINEIVNAIRTVAAGRHYFSPELSTYLLNRANRPANLAERAPTANELTRAETLSINLRKFEPSSDRPISHYRILKKLGAGGMGEVYLAEDFNLGRQVAVKVLNHELTDNPEHLQRFEREARAASALNHPNILTVYEIGEAEGANFIATEFIEGESLRQRIDRGPIELAEILDTAIQTASALEAAHEARIVHRDIKPDNIMVREDHLVKVLDFGLAKLVRQELPELDSEGDTKALVKTTPGVVMGTPEYMSPEQIRQRPIDARTDIWSLGVLLYEMVAGKKPFHGETFGDVIAAILRSEPPNLSEIASGCPPELGRIVAKALQKSRQQRYQSVKNFATDLKELRRQLAFAAELERTGAAERTDAPTAAIGTHIHTTSSAEYLVNQVTRHKRVVALALIPFLIAVTILLYSVAFKPKGAVLTDKDTIMLADIDNTTGDPVFDGALKQGLAVTLGQSPFLDIFPEARVRETLQLMQRQPNERVSEAVAREICQRQGLKAFLSGSIAQLGSHYVIMLKAVNAQSGDEIAREQTEAESKERVLTALSQAAVRLREQLGENLSSIQKFAAPIEQATTSSLEALKAYSLGLEQANSGDYPKAIPFYQRAVELDPKFAVGYQALAREQLNSGFHNEAIASASKAYELRERASENEKLFITLIYDRVVTHDLEKAIEVGEIWKQTYPRFWRTYHALADLYLDVGEFEKAAANGREAVRLNPKVAATYSNYAGALMYLNRFDEAEQIYRQAFANNLDAPEYHMYLYWNAYRRSDATGVQQQLDWALASSFPYWSFALQAQSAALAGLWRKSRELSNRAIELQEARGMKGLVAWTASHWALSGAAFGDCQNAKQKATQALQNSQDATFSGSMMVFALCGDAAEAEAHVKRFAASYPNDTRLNGIWLPVTRAALELQRGQAANALELLAPVARYEPAADFQPQYLRGLCYLRLGKGAEAAAEFQKILKSQGQTDFLVSTLYPLAQLGLARALGLQADKAQARQHYEAFFALWKDADADLPVLIEARKEYERLIQ